MIRADDPSAEWADDGEEVETAAEDDEADKEEEDAEDDEEEREPGAREEEEPEGPTSTSRLSSDSPWHAESYTKETLLG